ncbi:MAG: Gfo/Idh/MocA family oxidoreductase [Ruminococcaceae bacterium]|nr:Gfo/Idh/MocA family oxidoreductase [Oscillospiraceae bacterium]
MDKIKYVVIGAGSRGAMYANQAKKYCPELELVAVADQNPVRRNYIKENFGLSDECCYKCGEDLLALPKIADAAIIATQDKDHYSLAMKAIEKGYHLLLEKPIAPTPEECVAIEKAANDKGVMILVCHVLRYTPFFTLIKKIIDDGKIGKPKNVIHVEAVQDLHYSHSYVRGDWHKTSQSAPMILAKSCHDIDIIQWLLNERCTKVQSFGSLTYFCNDNKPEGAPEFCYQGCPHEEECPYSAVKLYRNRQVAWFAPQATKIPSPTAEDIEKLITETNYGRCVFQCDNDVVDQQVVNMEFESGATASFVMSAFNQGGRRIRIMGTKGELEGAMGQDHITVYDFSTRKSEQISIRDFVSDESIVGGHGGGDAGIVRAFGKLMTGTYTGSSFANITTSVDNHLTTFAAEKSRLTDKVVFMNEYRNELYNQD